MSNRKFVRINRCLSGCKIILLGEVLPIHLFRHFCCRMYRFATQHSVTDRQTDRQTTVWCQQPDHKVWASIPWLTRQLSYRKEDSAMRPIYGCPEKFWESSTHPATFPEICNGLLFRSILRMCVQKLKFVSLPVPEIIGGTQKIWAVPVYAHAPFSPKFLIGFCLHGPSEYICQIWRL